MSSFNRGCMTLQSLKHWLSGLLQKKFAGSWCNQSWPSPLHSLTTGWWILLSQISLPDHWSVNDSMLTHSCLLLYLCKGLPKAAKINHYRLWYGASFATASRVRKDDVIYTTLPLYHSAALMVGLHGCIVTGKTFLSTRHWSPVHIHMCSTGKVIQNLPTFLSARDSV